MTITLTHASCRALATDALMRGKTLDYLGWTLIGDIAQSLTMQSTSGQATYDQLCVDATRQAVRCARAELR